MKISNSEKLIIALLDNISKHLNIDKNSENISSRFVMSAIYSGNEWAIPTANNFLFDDTEEKPPYIKELHDFLWTWSIIEDSYNKLTEEDKEKVKSANFNMAPSFEGFDGNGESEYRAATEFMVEKMTNCFSFLGDRCHINSHSQKVPKYRAMHEKLMHIIDTTLLNNQLTADEIIEIIKY